jgi:hypothetical protein
MKEEETKRMMTEVAGDYDRLSEDANRLVTQKAPKKKPTVVGGNRRPRRLSLHRFRMRERSRCLWRAVFVCTSEIALFPPYRSYTFFRRSRLIRMITPFKVSRKTSLVFSTFLTPRGVADPG